MDRQTRRDIKHDKFVDDVELAYEAARRNAKIIVGAIAGVLLLAAIGWGVWWYQSRQEDKAQNRLADAVRIMEAPVGQPGAGGKIDYNTEEEKFAKAEPILTEVTEKYGSSDAADLAGLFIARIAASRGDIAKARPQLEAFVKDHGDHILAGSARVGLYQIDLASGPAGAKKVSDEIEKDLANKSQQLPGDVALALLAEAYEIQGDSVKARDAYQRIVNEYPDSPYSLDAQRKTFRG